MSEIEFVDDCENPKSTPSIVIVTTAPLVGVPDIYITNFWSGDTSPAVKVLLCLEIVTKAVPDTAESGEDGCVPE